MVQITMTKITFCFFRILQKQFHIILKVSWNFLCCFQAIHDICVPIFYLKSCKFMSLFCWLNARVCCCQDEQNKWQNCLILFSFLPEQKRSLQSDFFPYCGYWFFLEFFFECIILNMIFHAEILPSKCSSCGMKMNTKCYLKVDHWQV